MYNTPDQERKILSTLTDKPKKPKKKTEKQIFFMKKNNNRASKCKKKICTCNL